MVDPSAFLSVRALFEGYRAGRFTPIDVCHSAVARLRMWEPRLNAFIDPMTDEVMRQAEQATGELAQGEDRGPLHGVPIAIKDIIDIAGIATSYATKAAPPAPRRAGCRLRAPPAAGRRDPVRQDQPAGICLRHRPPGVRPDQ